jgi:hypothetical protein
MPIVRNMLAVIGVIAIVAVVALGVLKFLDNYGLCEKRIGQTAAVSDVKASVFQFDCGAIAATRTYVTLSNPGVDGWNRGDVVLTLLRLETTGSVELGWKDNRHLRIAYPASAQIGYSVTKIHGVEVELAPQPAIPTIPRNVGSTLVEANRGC